MLKKKKDSHSQLHAATDLKPSGYPPPVFADAPIEKLKSRCAEMRFCTCRRWIRCQCCDWGALCLWPSERQIRATADLLFDTVNTDELCCGCKGNSCCCCCLRAKCVCARPLHCMTFRMTLVGSPPHSQTRFYHPPSLCFCSESCKTSASSILLEWPRTNAWRMLT